MRCAVCDRKIDFEPHMFIFHSDENNRDEYACETCKEQFAKAQATQDPEAINYLRVYIDEMPDGETKSKLTKKLEEVISGKSTLEYGKETPTEQGGLHGFIASEGTFGNIGGKIKTVTKVFCYIGMIVCIIAGFVVLISSSDSSYYNESNYKLSTGLFLLFGGPFICWLSSLMTYGFGELIDEVKKNNCLLEQVLGEKAGKRG